MVGAANCLGGGVVGAEAEATCAVLSWLRSWLRSWLAGTVPGARGVDGGGMEGRLAGVRAFEGEAGLDGEAGLVGEAMDGECLDGDGECFEERDASSRRFAAEPVFEGDEPCCCSCCCCCCSSACSREGATWAVEGSSGERAATLNDTAARERGRREGGVGGASGRTRVTPTPQSGEPTSKSESGEERERKATRR